MLHLVTVTPKGCFEMNCISNHADPAELESLLCQLATHSQNSWTWGVLERDILVSRTLCPQSHHPSAKYHKEAPCCTGCACTIQDVKPNSLSASSMMDTYTPSEHTRAPGSEQVHQALPSD